MSNCFTKLIASVVIASSVTQVAAQQANRPNPFDWKKPGLVEIGVVSFVGAVDFAANMQAGIVAADLRADGILRFGVDEIEDFEVMVVFASDWANAGFVNAGLFASIDLRDYLKGKEDSDSWIDVQFVESPYRNGVYALFVLTEIDGELAPDDCLVQAVTTTLYQGAIEPVFDMAHCIEVSR